MDLKVHLTLTFTLIAVVSSREVEIENFTPDPKVNATEFFDYGTLRLKKERRNHYSISGDFELFENSGNEKELLLEVRDKRNKVLMMRSQDKFCDFLKHEKQVWPDVQQKSNFPEGNPCPLPKGKYWLKDLAIDEKKFIMIPPGEYHARVAAIQNDRVLAAVDVYCRILP
ncbi:uncharacterized protein [Chironomus tepperi]|uniref:uncharacterized protein n=1 Tax=Chironomus tepperi TaxID=113505 RepID=UPI00391EF663